MTQVSIRVYGDDLVARELDLTGARGESMIGIWPVIEETFEEIEREQFASDGSRGPNGPWPELTQDWMWHKFRTGQSLAILRASEDMEAALTGPSPDSIRATTDDTFEFGADLDQFRIQQDWSSANNFPARYPVDLQEQDELRFAEAILGWVAGTVNTAGQRVHPRTRRFTGGRVLR